MEALKESGGGGRLIEEYELLFGKENICWKWEKFRRGKLRQRLVREFWLNLESEVNSLYHDLASGRYRHGGYQHFRIYDPKKRDIYVASVRDRVVHQIIFDYLFHKYDQIFYFHSYASRPNKGLHLARKYFIGNCFRLYRSRRTLAVKMDVKKYFSNIDHNILNAILRKRTKNELISNIISQVIVSFGENGKGLPLGNLTSQVLANIYLNELDWHIKKELKIKHYIRYNDDLLFLAGNRPVAEKSVKMIRSFTKERLGLEIPESKIDICQFPGVIDVLGLQTNGLKVWPRPKTVLKAKKELNEKLSGFDDNLYDSLCSYREIIGSSEEYDAVLGVIKGYAGD